MRNQDFVRYAGWKLTLVDAGALVERVHTLPYTAVYDAGILRSGERQHGGKSNRDLWHCKVLTWRIFIVKHAMASQPGQVSYTAIQSTKARTAAAPVRHAAIAWSTRSAIGSSSCVIHAPLSPIIIFFLLTVNETHSICRLSRPRKSPHQTSARAMRPLISLPMLRAHVFCRTNQNPVRKKNQKHRAQSTWLRIASTHRKAALLLLSLARGVMDTLSRIQPVAQHSKYQMTLPTCTPSRSNQPRGPRPYPQPRPRLHHPQPSYSPAPLLPFTSI